MKKYLCALIAILLLLPTVVCCDKNDLNVEITPQPRQTFNNETDDSNEIIVSGTFGSDVKASLTNSVAYCLTSASKSEVYFAGEYLNSGDCPITLDSVEIAFSINGNECAGSFNIPGSQYSVVYPGEKSFFAIWTPNTYSDSDSVTNGSEIVISDITLNSKLADSYRIKFDINNEYLAQNYTDFISISGNINATGNTEEACSFANIYSAFFDSNEKLLGVWYFTGSCTTSRFTSHMVSLNINDLLGRVDKVSSVGYGVWSAS